ncbi:zinc finger A20 and AN1 domain-containing stress-associated protein 5-like [Phragmites australis]|uniref:zinc finger A20 and AN1 domain-containing stress-associated protein 5-like n=1 Tax=Phragmites australis TaxID=29695 RepID=UPI002D76DA3E|nr:zinc finger A20 and AN1 domain-containing stress-associated protein 5-like [Phragmites australis]
MAEEQRWQEGHRLCANNCGFFGSPATLDLCSKCYRDSQQHQHPTAIAAAPAPPASASSASPPSSSTAATEAGICGIAASASSEPSPSAAAAKASGRCARCRKRVGLTGFACRCGATFCGVHRYPELHACVFDFRAAGRDAIARANPVVKGDKLKDKI